MPLYPGNGLQLSCLIHFLCGAGNSDVSYKVCTGDYLFKCYS